MQIGIVAALADEAKTLASGNDDDTALVEISGPGPRRAQQAAERLLNRGATHLVSWGTAAGLDPALHAGHIVVYSETVRSGGERHTTATAWADAVVQRLGSLTPSTGAGYTVERPVSACAEKQRLFAETGCIALDMESGPIAACADNAHVPFIAIRAIVDNAATELPESAIRALGGDGQINVMKLVGTLLTRPTDVPRLVRLGMAYRNGLSALRDAATLLTPGFSVQDIAPQI